MTSFDRKYVRRGPLAMGLGIALALTFCRPSFAQDSAAGEPTPPAASPKPNLANEPAPPPSQSLGPLERLPISAYPETHVRGLHGGSLWSTFHGMQWPYYPKTGIGVSGYAWVDTGYEHISRGNPSETSINTWLQQGRLLLRVTPTWSNGTYFVQAQAELVANKDQSSGPPQLGNVDDAWIRFGRWNTFDVQVGRYEAWEIYHFGMGLDINTQERQGATGSNSGLQPPNIYGVTYAFYRPASVGEVAIHLYPTDWLRFELGGQLGDESGENVFAGRPVGILDLGWLKLKLGGEYKKQSDQNVGAKGELTQRGVGGALQFVIDPYVEFGVNGAYGLVDHVSSVDGSIDQAGSNTTYSVGGFLNARVVEDLLVGGGANFTNLEDTHFDTTLRRNGKFDQWQTFGAIQYLLLKQLYMKFVFAYSVADFSPSFTTMTPFKNEMLSGRLRLQYLF
ncbi:MAG: carbohydrate porin [Myxococcota bacterium]|nr:carbohydrate porin [Myxococcota bacterium]